MLNKLQRSASKLLNQKVRMKDLYIRGDSEIIYYSRKIGKIKGIKKLNRKLSLYLIEFYDYNRIWFIKQEFRLGPVPKKNDL